MIMNANTADQLDDLDTDAPVEEPAAEEPKVDSPIDALEARIAQFEQAQSATQRQVQQLNAAVGRVQSLADKFDKTGDPKVEEKVRAAMAEVYEVLGDVSDGIDPAILPDSARARVATAREAARKAANQADIERREKEIEQRVRDSIAPKTDDSDPNAYARALEVQVVSEIVGLGLDPDDKAFDWEKAKELLHGAGGADAMFKYVRAQERALLSGSTSDEPSDDGVLKRKRPVSPAPAAASNDLDPLDPARSLEDRNKWLRDNGII